MPGTRQWCFGPFRLDPTTAILWRDAAKADAIVTTEKDAVKIADRDIIAIPIEFVIDDFTKILAVIDK